MHIKSDYPSRRDAIRRGLATGVGLLGGGKPLHEWLIPQADVITRPIPSTGERIPVVGLGTNNYSAATPEALAPRRAVLLRLPELGGSVVDTAANYGRAEEVIGQIVSEADLRDRLFIVTKVTAPGNDVARGREMLEQSFRRLRMVRIDLVMVHDVSHVALFPLLREWKESGRIRYVGVSTSSNSEHQALAELMRSQLLDFIQVNYSVGNRASADVVLPLAAERGIAVMTNVPFGGRRSNVVAEMAGRPLPDFAAAIGATSWAQLALKYNVSHPAVTVAIPGTTRVEHLEDNMRAARGPLPDAVLRRRIVDAFDAA